MYKWRKKFIFFSIWTIPRAMYTYMAFVFVYISSVSASRSSARRIGKEGGIMWSMELGQNCYRVSTGFQSSRWFKSSRWTFNGFSAVLYSPGPRNLLHHTICPDTFLIRRARTFAPRLETEKMERRIFRDGVVSYNGTSV